MSESGLWEGQQPKTTIISELGERALLLPSQVNEGLAANDCAKYLMTLLQAARAHADAPDQFATNLERERLAAGVDEAGLDSVVALSRTSTDGVYVIPGLRRIQDCLADEVRRMIRPLRTLAGSATPTDNEPANFYEERLRTLLAGRPSLDDDQVSAAEIDRLTSGSRAAGDSLHLLVMDLHKELNRLQEQLASETIDGACTYAIREDDRPVIAAFMAGVNRTRALKFDHPGLGTTATRSGDRLVIQNDIGLTEAHVLVVHVEDARVTLTYTDNHIERLRFLQDLFEGFDVRWGDARSTRSAELREGMYHLAVGTYTAKDSADLQAYLTFLGSRLVFLIDWNRARKQLRKFAPRRVCLDVLRWAADHEYGHRGFLTLGGEQLILDALQSAGKLPLPPGGQLADFLGADRTAEFLKFTLCAASDGLRAGRSESLVRDEVSAELRHYVATPHEGLLTDAAEHASLIVELATAARDVLMASPAPATAELIQRSVDRARTWEHRADGLVSRSRTALRREDAAAPIVELLSTADDAADGLEDAIFRLSLLRSDPMSEDALAPLRDLAALLVAGAQEYLKAVENARELHRGSPRDQVADFLEAVDRTVTIEHQADNVHRQVQSAVLGFPGDYKQWYLFTGVADQLEGSSDALMRAALLLRDDVLGDLLRR
ncbi:MAG: hypothetical protein H6Q86_1497 [candidate division NC10 bacterium]|nr:hypothetical protein [candidate division NC10 bacterium]